MVIKTLSECMHVGSDVRLTLVTKMKSRMSNLNILIWVLDWYSWLSRAVANPPECVHTLINGELQLGDVCVAQARNEIHILLRQIACICEAGTLMLRHVSFSQFSVHAVRILQCIDTGQDFCNALSAICIIRSSPGSFITVGCLKTRD